jgi:hypothetical protein
MTNAKRGLWSRHIVCFSLMGLMGITLSACGGDSGSSSAAATTQSSGNSGSSGSSASSGSGGSTTSSGSSGVSGSPAASSAGVTLAWQPPTENTDGSTLTDLIGYKIHYGTESQNYTSEVSVDNPTLSRYVVENLPAGTYYFALTAYNSNGTESLLSDEVTATLN